MFFPKSLIFSIPLVILRMEDENDRQFVTELYQKYKLNMYYTARRIVKDPHTAEDIVQESCIAIINNLEKVKAVEVCRRRAYIVSLVKNTSINYVVKRNRQSKYSFIADDEILSQQPDLDSDIEEQLIHNCEIAIIKSALLKLSEKDRTILRMKYFDDLRDGDIANYLNIKANSVRYYLTLARRRLYASMMELNGEK